MGIAEAKGVSRMDVALFSHCIERRTFLFSATRGHCSLRKGKEKSRRQALKRTRAWIEAKKERARKQGK